jgi:hypothetical protein
MAFAAGALTLVSALAAPPTAAAVRNAEDLLVVDCLLPGQIRQLGRQATFMSARRPIRTTQADCQIRGGEYVAYDRANYQTALKVWLDQAMAGSAEAQNNVGEIYAKGLGTPPDYGMAFQWFRKAADQGYARAKINLGWLYEEGLGVAKDPAAALNLYRDAAGNGDSLLYASDVKVQLEAKDAQITGLESAVERERAASAVLRDQVEALKAQLAERRRALQSARAELQATRDRLAEAQKASDPELIKLLEGQLLAQEDQIGRQRNSIAALERQASIGAGAPTLEVLQPQLVAVRGSRSGIVPGAPGERTITGRVSVPAVVATIEVNGTAVPMAANGVFQAKLAVAPGGSPVRIVATDKTGGVATMDFTVLPSAPGTGATATVSAASAPRLGLGRYVALVIGNNRYRDAAYPALASAVNDATAVSNLLASRYGFDSRLLLNATRLDMLSAINDLRQSLKPEDNLLIYYAGHGELGDGGEGYWVPADGLADRPDTWVSNRAISDQLETLPAKRVLLVADSCYSGTMTASSVPTLGNETRGADQLSAWLKEAASGRSRLALTSGGVQPVQDISGSGHSFFADAFLQVLKDNGGLLDAHQLYREVAGSVALATLDSPLPQTPEFAPIRFAGHESGTFVLATRGATAAGAP